MFDFSSEDRGHNFQKPSLNLTNQFQRKIKTNFRRRTRPPRFSNHEKKEKQYAEV